MVVKVEWPYIPYENDSEPVTQFLNAFAHLFDVLVAAAKNEEDITGAVVPTFVGVMLALAMKHPELVQVMYQQFPAQYDLMADTIADMCKISLDLPEDLGYGTRTQWDGR